MSRGRKLTVAAAAIAIVAVLGWLGARWLIASLVNGALGERGMACAPVEATPSADLRRVDIAPTRCTFEAGQIRWLRAPAGAVVHLDEEQRATRVAVPGLELDMREEPPRELIASLVETGEVPPRLRRAIDGLAALSTREDLPRVEIDRLLVQRDTRSVTLRDVVVDRDGDALAIRVAAVAPPPVGRRRLRFAGRLTGLSARASASEVHASGRIDLEVTIGRRELSEVIPFRIDAHGIEGDEAEYRARVSLPERLRELRERRQQRLDARERAAERPQGDPRARIHDAATRLRRAVDRARARQDETPD